jgi:hypothetical protein
LWAAAWRVFGVEFCRDPVMWASSGTCSAVTARARLALSLVLVDCHEVFLSVGGLVDAKRPLWVYSNHSSRSPHRTNS